MRAISIVAVCLLAGSGCWHTPRSQSVADFDFNLDDDSDDMPRLEMHIYGLEGAPKKAANHKLFDMLDGQVWRPLNLNMTVQAVEVSDARLEFIATLPDGSTHNFDLNQTKRHAIRMTDGSIVEFSTSGAAIMSDADRDAILELFHQERNAAGARVSSKAGSLGL